jgi:dienelactone hydrolase
MTQPVLRIFVSSTYLDLIPYRQAAEKAINDLGEKYEGMEYMGALAQEPTRASLDLVERCDLFIGIYAWRTGHIPEDSDISITRQEYEHAKKRGAKIYADVLGLGMSGDAYHMTTPSVGGDGARANRLSRRCSDAHGAAEPHEVFRGIHKQHVGCADTLDAQLRFRALFDPLAREPEGWYFDDLEVEDALAARDWAVDNHPRVDPGRVGILGWSHGGLIALHSLFDHPDKYAVGFAGVPVSDLVQRMGYLGPRYQAYYDVDYHIGETPAENLEEYKRRSPVWNVEKLTRPLRIHGNVSDEDVNVIEVEHLVQALKAAGKTFEYEIYDLPGGHSFDRLDSPEAWSVRPLIYEFLARYLDPPRPNVQLGLRANGRAAP